MKLLDLHDQPIISKDAKRKKKEQEKEDTKKVKLENTDLKLAEAVLESDNLLHEKFKGIFNECKFYFIFFIFYFHLSFESK